MWKKVILGIAVITIILLVILYVTGLIPARAKEEGKGDTKGVALTQPLGDEGDKADPGADGLVEVAYSAEDKAHPGADGLVEVAYSAEDGDKAHPGADGLVDVPQEAAEGPCINDSCRVCNGIYESCVDSGCCVVGECINGHCDFPCANVGEDCTYSDCCDTAKHVCVRQGTGWKMCQWKCGLPGESCAESNCCLEGTCEDGVCKAVCGVGERSSCVHSQCCANPTHICTNGRCTRAPCGTHVGAPCEKSQCCHNGLECLNGVCEGCTGNVGLCSSSDECCNDYKCLPAYWHQVKHSDTLSEGDYVCRTQGPMNDPTIEEKALQGYPFWCGSYTDWHNSDEPDEAIRQKCEGKLARTDKCLVKCAYEPAPKHTNPALIGKWMCRNGADCI